MDTHLPQKVGMCNYSKQHVQSNKSYLTEIIILWRKWRRGRGSQEGETSAGYGWALGLQGPQLQKQ